MPPLEGISVVELGVMIAVPAATEALAGFGAAVIKVEDTQRGDEMRAYGSSNNGMSAWFANVNAGKRSISVDLNAKEGKEILWKLLAQADVFIQGFRTGVVDKLGFGYETVSSKLPELIYCSSTGFGESGPYRDLPAYDPLIQALSGWAGSQMVDGNPTLHKSMVADKTAAVFNTQAILAALVQRARTGKGCFIEASMLESNIMYNWPDVMMQCSLLEDEGLHLPNLFASYRLYQCADGHAAIACGTDRQWQSFCEALEGEEHLLDERFKSAPLRGANLVDFFNTCESLCSRFTVNEVIDRLRAGDVPVAPVHAPEAVIDDPQVRARGFIEERTHPRVGRFLGARQPASMFHEDLSLSPAPSQGEHTREILDELGFETSMIDSLVQAGVINCNT